MYFENVIYSCIFSIITPVFSVTWSSEIVLLFWFAAQKYFYDDDAENRMYSGLFDEIKVQKNSIYLK